jgi:hypothetical protein
MIVSKLEKTTVSDEYQNAINLYPVMYSVDAKCQILSKSVNGVLGDEYSGGQI